MHPTNMPGPKYAFYYTYKCKLVLSCHNFYISFCCLFLSALICGPVFASNGEMLCFVLFIQAVVKAVRNGDIPLFEKLLEKKNADMGMTWVS